MPINFYNNKKKHENKETIYILTADQNAHSYTYFSIPSGLDVYVVGTIYSFLNSNPIFLATSFTCSRLSSMEASPEDESSKWYKRGPIDSINFSLFIFVVSLSKFENTNIDPCAVLFQSLVNDFHVLEYIFSSVHEETCNDYIPCFLVVFLRIDFDEITSNH